MKRKYAAVFLPNLECGSETGRYVPAFFNVDTRVAYYGHPGSDPGPHAIPREVEERPVCPFKMGAAQLVVLFRGFGIEAHGNGVEAGRFEFRDDIPAGVHEPGVAVRVEPHFYAPFVKPARDPEHRVKPARRFPEAGENDLPVFRQVGPLELTDDLVFRRLPGEKQVVAVYTIRKVPDAERALSAAAVCYIEIEAAECLVDYSLLLHVVLLPLSPSAVQRPGAKMILSWRCSC